MNIQREDQLEQALLEYVKKFGLSDLARALLCAKKIDLQNRNEAEYEDHKSDPGPA